jgi:hypothetical protein
MLFYDFEVFKYDWLVVIKDMEKKETIEIINDSEKLKQFYEDNKNRIWAGYNSRHYDQYILKAILCDFNPKEVNDHIIVKKQGGWNYSNLFWRIPFLNYDVMISKLNSLKQLEGFMGNDIRETTVPFDMDRKLTNKEIREVLFYCNHDVEQTIEVFLNQTEEFESYMSLIKTFNLPLKYINKTKAQLSSIILDCNSKKYDDEFNISIVDCLRLNKYRHIAEWFMKDGNKRYSYKNEKNITVKCNQEVNINGIKHIVGWGGIHGAKDNYINEGYFVMSDIASMYPATMINFGFLSRNVRDPKKYKQMRDDRIELKKKKDPRQGSYKIVLNSTYGASKDKYNSLYDPLQANNICVNGQLLIVDLLEKLEQGLQEDCELVQSNTDGILVKLPDESYFVKYKEICSEWEERTGYELEHDHYRKVFQKDVNNYIIVDKDGNYKSKGAYVKELNKLDNDLPIVNKGVKDYFVNNIPVEVTINNCNDLIEFQKIVKISSKYKYGLFGDKKLSERVLRVFASRSKYDKGVFKVKEVKGENRIEKISNTPKRCFIDNSDINGKEIPRKLDKNYYINMANKRIRDFIGE